MKFLVTLLLALNIFGLGIAQAEDVTSFTAEEFLTVVSCELTEDLRDYRAIIRIRAEEDVYVERFQAAGRLGVFPFESVILSKGQVWRFDWNHGSWRNLGGFRVYQRFATGQKIVGYVAVNRLLSGICPDNILRDRH